MPSLEKPENSLTTTNVKWRWPATHPEGRKFGVVAAAITLFAFLLGWEVLGWLLVGLTVWVFAFFRDPIRTTPRGDNLIIAPADGLITMITRVPPPRELADTLNEMRTDGTYGKLFEKFGITQFPADKPFVVAGPGPKA